MRKIFVFALLLFVSTMAVPFAYGQANNGSVGGVVQDTSKALIPGVNVTLTNTQTGVVDTRITNDSGAYSFAAVPPGIYKVSGELTGFRTAVEDNVKLGTGAQVRVDLVLQIGAAVGDVVQVSVATSENRINETSSSV